MAEKKAITREMRRRYHKASKAGKATMLDELVALTGWCRSYASRVLRHEPKKRHGPETRGR
ncbi:MAG: transposase, partial [Coriobacteriia bacterium]|nr:transposase [Coriobacteriia bacterium]